MTDREYIDGLKTGNEHIFRLFVEQHQLHLLRLCNGFVHNHEDSRDLVQDIFIEVFRSVHSFREDSRLSTWLYRIAVNKSLNFVRKNKKFIKEGDLFSSNQRESITELPDKSELPDQKIEKIQSTELIRKAIDSLQKNQRIAFILNKYEDLAYKEISDIMGISLSSVESLIHRAKMNLQKKLVQFYKKNNL